MSEKITKMILDMKYDENPEAGSSRKRKREDLSPYEELKQEWFKLSSNDQRIYLSSFMTSSSVIGLSSQLDDFADALIDAELDQFVEKDQCDEPENQKQRLDTSEWHGFSGKIILASKLCLEGGTF